MWYATKYGDKDIANILLAKQQAPTVSELPTVTTHIKSRKMCDACTLDIDVRGGFTTAENATVATLAFATDCLDCGVRCLVPDHDLVKEDGGTKSGR